MDRVLLPINDFCFFLYFIATRNTKMEQEMSSLQTDLSQVKNEKSDLLSMNENLSNQVSDHLNTIKKLQDKEQDLLLKLENSKRDLELAHNGMTAGKYILKVKYIFKKKSSNHKLLFDEFFEITAPLVTDRVPGFSLFEN